MAKPRFGESMWYLEGYSADSKRLWRFPFLDGDQLRIRDLGSTNGTFVNGDRIQSEQRLHDGDILHFSSIEFRLGKLQPHETDPIAGTPTSLDPELPRRLIEHARLLDELLRSGAVTAAVPADRRSGGRAADRLRGAR